MSSGMDEYMQDEPMGEDGNPVDDGTGCLFIVLLLILFGMALAIGMSK